MTIYSVMQHLVHFCFFLRGATWQRPSYCGVGQLLDVGLIEEKSKQVPRHSRLHAMHKLRLLFGSQAQAECSLNPRWARTIGRIQKVGYLTLYCEPVPLPRM